MSIATPEPAMRTRFALAALAAATLSTLAAAQMGPGMGHGMGPGMMGGPGTGAADRPMGQGPDAGMTGRGMMHRHGMGGGMMGGRGMGMMEGPGLAAIEALNLTDDQRGKLTEIRRDLQRRNHALMGSLREVRWKSQDAAKAPEFDATAARKRYKEGAAIRKQMFEARLDARVKAEAVLTREQREQLRKNLQARPPQG
jgi:Spy/CpxP family protein refolding chaperone